MRIELLDRVKGRFSESNLSAFIRIAIHGEPAAQVAAKMGMTLGAVRVAQHRILRALKESVTSLSSDKFDQSSHPDPKLLEHWFSHRVDEMTALEIEAHLVQCDECAKRLDYFSSPETPVPDRNAKLDQTSVLNDGTWLSHNTVLEQLSWLPNAGDRVNSELPPRTSGNSSRWKLERLLAKGGVGEVWLATDVLFGRKVALKRLQGKHAHVKTVQQRFLREAQITARVNHPGTAYVLDFQESGPDSYYVMSLVEGSTLRTHIEKYHQQRTAGDGNNAELIQLLSHFAAVANTVAYAHSLGIIHRDLKSDNVIIGQFGQVTLVDWGLAKRIGDADIRDEEAPNASSPSHTRLGARVGTPSYMAPEQVRGENDTLDHRTDVYGLSAMLYEIMTGQAPTSGSSVDEIFNTILTLPPRRFSDHGIHSFDSLEAICLQGLSKRREDRPSSVSLLSECVTNWVANVLQQKQTNTDRERFFSMTHDLMALLDEDKGIRWANPAWEFELGWKPSELIGKTHIDLMHPDNVDDVGKKLALLETGGSITGIEPRMLCKNGGYKWFLWTASRLTEEKLFYVIGTNIDDRCRREETLSSVIDGVPEAMAVIDAERVVRFVNRHAEELLGYDKESLLGRRIDEWLAKAFQPQLRTLLNDYLHFRKPAESDAAIPMAFLKRDGAEIMTQVKSNAVHGADGILVVLLFR